MTALIIIFGVLFYAACWLLTSKATFAYFQKTYPTLAKTDVGADRAIAVIMGLGGPASLVMVFFLSDRFKHGFTTKEDQS